MGIKQSKLIEKPVPPFVCGSAAPRANEENTKTSKEDAESKFLLQKMRTKKE